MLFLMAATAENSANDEFWCLDTGFSHHMTGLFVKLDETMRRRIKFADHME